MSRIDPNQIDWTKQPFKSVNDAIVTEASRTGVGAKFLPLYGPVPSSNMTVSSDTIGMTDTTHGKVMSVDQTATTPIIELMVPFRLTQEQYDQEHLDTAVTLSTRAANLLAQAKDLVFFQGNAQATLDFFRDNPITVNGSGLPTRLVSLLNPPPLNKIAVLPKASKAGTQRKYGEHTSSAVGRAYSLLQSKGHNGPYALLLHSDIYADIVESLDNTLIMPKDRIMFFVTETATPPAKDEVRCYGTGALRPFSGLFMSLGGDTMDAVAAIGPAARFSTRESGALRFEVFERFTLRLKDPTAVVLLDFAQG